MPAAVDMMRAVFFVLSILLNLVSGGFSEKPLWLENEYYYQEREGKGVRKDRNIPRGREAFYDGFTDTNDKGPDDCPGD